MKKIFDFIKLWWGKIFKFTTKKNFIFIYPSVVLLLNVIFTHSFLMFLGLMGWFVTIVSNTQKSELD